MRQITPVGHPRESGGPGQALLQWPWIPAFAGMTNSAVGEIGGSSSGQSQTKKARRCRYPLAIALAVAGCAPGAAEYSKAEAPNRLQVEGGTSTAAIAFAPGSSRLSDAAARQVDRLVTEGDIGPPDRVVVAASGPPALAAAREAAVAGELLRWGIVARAQTLPVTAANRAIVTVGRYAIRLPACPNWSQPRANDFTNAPPSNFGCATAVNLGLLVASPADLVSARNLGPAAGKPAAAAVDRYLNDQIPPLPADVALGPIAGGASITPPGPASPTATSGP